MQRQSSKFNWSNSLSFSESFTVLHWQFFIPPTLQVNCTLQRGQFFSSPAFIHKYKLYFVILAKPSLCNDVDF
jgi:hypothetical protein